MKPADRARWKAHERETAAILGGERVPSNGKRQVDIEHPYFFIEHKERRAVPEWWSKAWDQLADCPADKVPLLVFVYPPGQGRRVQRYAVLRLDDLAELYRQAAKDQPGSQE